MTACIVGYGSRQGGPVPGGQALTAWTGHGRLPRSSTTPTLLPAVGGSSVIGTAKAMAMLLGKGGDPLDYLGS